MFFPIFWMVLASFKTEAQAIADAARVLLPRRRWRTTRDIFSRADYPLFARNSIIISLAATAIMLVVAVPAAFAMAFYPTQADARHAAVDAVHQDAAGGRRAGADLPDRARTPACWIRGSR